MATLHELILGRQLSSSPLVMIKGDDRGRDHRTQRFPIASEKEVTSKDTETVLEILPDMRNT